MDYNLMPRYCKVHQVLMKPPFLPPPLKSGSSFLCHSRWKFRLKLPRAALLRFNSKKITEKQHKKERRAKDYSVQLANNCGWLRYEKIMNDNEDFCKEKSTSFKILNSRLFSMSWLCLWKEKEKLYQTVIFLKMRFKDSQPNSLWELVDGKQF